MYDSLRERTLERERTRLNQEERVASGFTRERHGHLFHRRRSRPADRDRPCRRDDGRRAHGDCLNRLLLGTIDTIGRHDRWPVELHAGLIGAAVGILAWFAPDLVGGGDAITQRALLGVDTFAKLPLVFLLRLGFGAISYAAGTVAFCLEHSKWPHWERASLARAGAAI